MASKAASKAKRDLYQEVTERIVEALERGVAPWVRPWAGAGLPVNATTGAAYRGINVLLLWARAGAEDYGRDRWLTFNQARAAGGCVRKGERGTLCTKYLMAERKTRAADGTTSTERYPVLTHFTLFNVEQCDELPDAVRDGPEPGVFSPIEDAQAYFTALGANIQHGRDSARYERSTDRIVLPAPERFHSPEAYYGTLAHEHVHWTGHESRCAREAAGVPAHEDYPFEELVAEMGAAFVCAHLGLSGALQHPEFIERWLSRMKGDNRLVFKAARGARLAVEFLNALVEENEDPREEEATGGGFDAMFDEPEVLTEEALTEAA